MFLLWHVLHMWCFTSEQQYTHTFITMSFDTWRKLLMWHISEVVQLAHYCSLVDVSTEEMILVFNTTLKWLSFWVTFEEGNNGFNIRNLQALDLGFSEVLEWKGGMTSLGLWICQVSDVVSPHWDMDWCSADDFKCFQQFWAIQNHHLVWVLETQQKGILWIHVTSFTSWNREKDKTNFQQWKLVLLNLCSVSWCLTHLEMQDISPLTQQQHELAHWLGTKSTVLTSVQQNTWV